MSTLLNQEFICVDSGVIFQVKEITKNKIETKVHFQSIWDEKEKGFVTLEIYQSKLNNGEFAILSY